MKKTVIILVVSTLASSGCYSQSPYSPELQRAFRNGAKMKNTLRIVNDQGTPVTNAHVWTGYTDTRRNDVDVRGLTDTNGLFVVEGNATVYGIMGSINKDGYYKSTFKEVFFKDKADWVKDGRWQPWNPTIPVVLRDIRNPIPMYAKMGKWQLKKDVPVGFDCEKGDFVAPHGSGTTADFLIRVAGGGKAFQFIHKTVSLDSLDSKGGFVVLKKHNYSDFKSEYLAPEFGYSTNLSASSSFEVNKGIQGTSLYDAGGEYLVFKSRIVRDDEGNIISANYGKIYGELQYFGGEDGGDSAGAAFTYYFNPTPNDRNIEFDGKDPLFRATDWRKPPEWSREP